MTQYSGVYTLQTQGQALTSGQWATDPYYKNTTLLLHADGVAGGAQNNTFIDGSTNNFPITRNGNTTQGSFTPYGPDWSNYFDGTGDYLSLATATAIGSGDNTIEFWFYPTGSSSSTYYCLYDSRSTTGTNTGYGIFQYNSTIEVYGNGLKVTSAASAFSSNTWIHLALVRASGSCQLYINGVASGSAGTYSSDLTSTKRKIGDSENNLYPYAGYVSNLRETTGALYSGTFSPSTVPLTTTVSTGTVALLTCQSNRFVDNSTNGYAIVPNGNTSVQRFSPFAPQYQYTPAVIGGSGYFDGVNDYLTIGASANLQPASSDFCVEAWVYPTIVGGARYVYSANDNSTGTNLEYRIYYSTSGVFAYYYATGAYLSQLTTATPLVANQWSHIAWTRSGSTISLFVNGVRVATGSISGGSSASTAYVYVGEFITTANNQLTGYMTDLRFVKGSYIYDPSSATLTVPTTPLTAVTNTQLLLNYTNAGITDNAMMNNLETVGNAQVSTSVVKYGSGSMYFDGSGDYLVNAASPNLTLGSGDFTLECWINPSSVSGTPIIVDSYDGASTGWQLYINSSVVKFYSGTASLLAGTTVLSTGTWYHVAVSRSGTSIKLFLNGVSEASTTSSAAYTNASNPLWIAAQRAAGPQGYYTGYIDDLRVTKGVARYTGNFIPPKVAMPNQ